MKKYGGDLTRYGQTGSLPYKDIEATYKRPKNAFELQDDNVDFDNLTFNELMALLPDTNNWIDENSDYWEDATIEHFSCKDGQTNAYVKQGVDEEVTQPLARTETTSFIWHIATDDNHIDFLAGGKVKAKGIEWFVLKVIQQDSTSTYQNKLRAMDTSPDNSRLRFLGLKTLICVGGIK